MKKIIVLAAVVLMSAGVVFVQRGEFYSTPPIGAIQDSDFWVSYVRQYGGVNAHKVLVRAAEELDANDSHIAAHAFGRALYETLGLPALFVCDDRFLYGCMHEFLGQALVREGIDIIPALHQSCGKDVQCDHAIGHGLIGYFGYDKRGLREAVATCERLSPDIFNGCGSGVFMEFNERTMLVGDNNSETPHSLGSNPLALCGDFSGLAASTCHFWQMPAAREGWSSEMENDALFKRLGNVCRSAQAEDRPFCIGGIGQAAVSAAKYDTSAAVRFCERASNSLQDEALCVAYAAKTLAGAVSRDAGDIVCAALPLEARGACERHAYSRALPSDFKL